MEKLTLICIIYQCITKPIVDHSMEHFIEVSYVE